MDGTFLIFRFRRIDQHIPVIILISMISQEVIIGVPASQQIEIVIYDHIFVMKPSHALPGHQQIDPVVDPDLHLVHGGQRLKICIAIHLLQRRESVHQNLYIHAPVCRLDQCGDHVLSALIRMKVKSGQNNPVPRLCKHVQSFFQCLFIIFNHAGSVTGSLIRIAFLWVEVLLIFFAHLGMPVIGQSDSQKHVQNKCQNNKYQISQFKPQSLFQCDSSSSASFRMRL